MNNFPGSASGKTAGAAAGVKGVSRNRDVRSWHTLDGRKAEATIEQKLAGVIKTEPYLQNGSLID